MIGKARGALGRVGDYYTRDRSTPRQDEDFVSSILSQLSIPSQEKDMSMRKILSKVIAGRQLRLVDVSCMGIRR